MKSNLYVMCGIPGSGKTTIAHNFSDIVISSDEVRKSLYGDASIQCNAKLVFQIVDELVLKSLQNKNVVYDATSISPKVRKRIIDKFKDKANIIGVYVNTSLDICISRNNNRERVVPESVIRKMYSNFTIPTLEEGFSKIIEIKNN